MTAPAFKIIVKKEFLLLSVLLSVIYISLEGYYHFYISDHFDYMGYIEDFSFLKYVITKLVFVLLLASSYRIYQQNKFLYSIWLLLVFFFYLPVSVLFSFSDFPSGFFIATTFFVSFFRTTLYIKFAIPNISVPGKYKSFILAVISIALFIPIAVKFTSNINLNTLLLSDIYKTREAFAKDLQGYLSYLYNLETKTLIPVALVFFMISKRYFWIAFFSLVLLYLFVISGNKIVYLTSILVIFFYYVGKDFVSKTSNFFLLILFLFTLFPLVDYFILPEPMLSGIFVNRLLFIPALLTHFYFDFFDGNPLLFAESHFFNLFSQSPYDIQVGYLMSKVYWNGSDAYMNNGIVSDGFTNLGYSGVVIFSVAFYFLFAFFNSLKLHKGYFGIFFSYLFIFLSVPFLTCFITGGVFFFLLSAVFILRENTDLI